MGCYSSHPIRVAPLRPNGNEFLSNRVEVYSVLPKEKTTCSIINTLTKDLTHTDIKYLRSLSIFLHFLILYSEKKVINKGKIKNLFYDSFHSDQRILEFYNEWWSQYGYYRLLLQTEVKNIKYFRLILFCCNETIKEIISKI